MIPVVVPFGILAKSYTIDRDCEIVVSMTLSNKTWWGDVLEENDPQQIDGIKNREYHTKEDDYDFQSPSHKRNITPDIARGSWRLPPGLIADIAGIFANVQPSPELARSNFTRLRLFFCRILATARAIVASKVPVAPAYINTRFMNLFF